MISNVSRGGGVEESKSSLQHCVVINGRNKMVSGGGGVEESKSSLQHCVVINGRNKMVSSGGGVQESKSSLQPSVVINGRRSRCCIMTNMFNNKPQLLFDVGGEIPEFLGRKIACSFGEWILLTVTSAGDIRPGILFNRLSKEIIELPVLDFTYNSCILTSHPYDPACHIVYFDTEGKFLIFFHLGSKEFTIKKWDHEFFPTGVGAVVAGKLFLNMKVAHRLLGVIDIKESTYPSEVVEMYCENPVLSFSYYYYFGSSGELFGIYQATRICYLTEFVISWADLLNKKWVRVKNLGTLAIFFGCGTAHVVECASVESGGIKANSVYFFEPFDLDNYYIYNLEHGTVTMIPIFSSSMEMETTKHQPFNWIMVHCDAPFLKGDQESICQDSEKENKASWEVEDVGVQNSWNTVPAELLNLIQLHLFGRDHAVFRVACKPWHQVSIRDYSIPSIPALLSSTTLLEVCQSSSPLLMFQEDISVSDDSVPIFRFLDPVHKKLYRTGIPELRKTDIHYSKDGWLLVCRRGDGSMFFFNPLTQEKIELPRLPTKNSRIIFPRPYTLSFSSVPTCSNCLVVWILDSLVFYTLRQGEQTWRRQEMGEFQERIFMRCPVVLNGLHHFMCMNRDMVVFDFKDDVECQFPYCQTCPTKFKRPDHHVQDYFLEDYFFEIDGALAFVSVEQGGREINIFKWNDLETCWEGGVDFGDKAMFLSRRGSFMEKIDDDDVGGLGNSIFLPMVDDAEEGVFYSLATHSYHTVYSGYSSELPYNVDKFLNGIWVKPDWKIIGDTNLKWFI